MHFTYHPEKPHIEADRPALGKADEGLLREALIVLKLCGALPVELLHHARERGFLVEGSDGLSESGEAWLDVEAARVMGEASAWIRSRPY